MDRMVCGYVSASGNVISGTGYRVDHVDPGLYTVFFDTAFNTIPSVVVTQVFNGDINYHGGDTRDNAVVVGILADRFRVVVGEQNGSHSDRRFTFIAAGS